MKGWKPALLALLALLASGGAFWLAPGPADDIEATQHGENPWALPTLPPREAPEQAHQRLQQLQPWGKSGATAMAGSTATGWRLRGVVRLEGQRYALVEVGGKVRRYGVGEALPLGEKLLSVQADRIEIETQAAERRTVVLYPRVEASAAAPSSGARSVVPGQPGVRRDGVQMPGGVRNRPASAPQPPPPRSGGGGFAKP